MVEDLPLFHLKEALGVASDRVQAENSGLQTDH